MLVIRGGRSKIMKYEVTIEEVKATRERLHCSMQHAKHIVIQDKLMKTLKYSCIMEDLRGVLLEVVSNGGLTFR